MFPWIGTIGSADSRSRVPLFSGSAVITTLTGVVVFLRSNESSLDRLVTNPEEYARLEPRETFTPNL